VRHPQGQGPAGRSAEGATPNLMRTMANAPAVLDGYRAFSGALRGGGLGPGAREAVALAVAGENGRGYCAAAHTFLAGKAGVAKRGRPAVVVVSASEFATLRKRKRGPEKTFVDHLLAMPKDDGAFPRMRLRPRKVRF